MSFKLSYKRLLSDTFIYSGFNILNKIVPFILLPFIVRLLPISDYGMYALFLNIEALLIPIVSLNMHASLSVHFYQEAYDQKKYFGTLISGIFIFCVLFFLISLFIPNSVIQLTGLNKNIFSLAIITSSLLAIFSSVSTLFRLLRKPIYYGIYNILQSLMLLIIMLLICKMVPSFMSLTISRVLFFLIFIGTSIFILYKMNLVISNFDFLLFRKTLKFSIPTVLYSVSAFIFLSSDRFLIKHFLGVELVGLYSAIFQLASIVSILGVSINAAWMPWLFEQLKKNDIESKEIVVKVSYTIIFAMILIGLIICIIFPLIVKTVLPVQYHSNINVGFPIIMGFVFEAIYLIVSPYILFLEKTKYNAIIGIIIAFVNVTFNILLIPSMGILGSSVSFFLSWFLLALSFFIFSYKMYPMPWLYFIKNKKSSI